MSLADDRRRPDPMIEDVLHKLEGVDKKVDEVNSNTKVISVKLFGSSDADDERDTGRLPKVEKSARMAHQRIDETNDRISKLVAPGGPVGMLRDRVNKWAGAIGALLILIDILSHFVARH